MKFAPPQQPPSFLLVLLLLLPSPSATAAPIPDAPFWQDVAVRVHHASELTNAVFKKLRIDKENTVYVLTDKGVARVYEDTLALDHSYRPLADKEARDITVSPDGDLYYLLKDEWFSGGKNGRQNGAQKFSAIAVASNGWVYTAGACSLRVSTGLPSDTRGTWHDIAGTDSDVIAPLGAADVVLLDRGMVQRVAWPEERSTPIIRWSSAPLSGKCLSASDHGIWVGSTNGLTLLNAETGAVLELRHTNRPVASVTSIAPVAGGLWVGTPKGTYFEDESGYAPYATPSAPGINPPHFRYYAGKRWLRDVEVVDLAVDRDGHLWVLTKTGLNKIEFRQTTMAAKADWFHRKIRSRNMRYGFTAERRMLVPGDITSSEMVDTDNDGGWTSYYIGALGAHYAVTHEEEIRRQAWESFAALERLQSIHTNIGFPARTFERKGYKFSDTDRWRDAPDPAWEWKGHTSSDEICSQTFAHAVMWELVATNATERARVATNFIPIVEHILAHSLYLIDVDGKPTLWGRWNPEYVNWFPPTIHDRQLNSAELTASLQLAFAMTGNPRYRDKAYEMFAQHGYLTNILSPMKLIAKTDGYVHLGINMGDEWNHSDDELAFFTYWPLVRFAFTKELRAKYLTIVHEHMEIERPERYPIWNFIAAACGAKDFDIAGSVWTLRGTPLDTIAWRVVNSHRQDLTKLPPNFMGREMKEILPPGERLIARINTQPFILDQGDDATDFPGDEYLLGYWLGRYVGAIKAP